MPVPAEVVVFGGGPAGCATALLLARWGHTVRLVTPAPGRRPTLAVSLPPSTAKLWRLLGVEAAIASAGFVPGGGNTVWWESDAPRYEPFAPGASGWQATTGRLEAVLAECAAAEGVHLEWRRVGADEARAWPAAFRVDATGRDGVLARQLGRRLTEPGPRTVALGALWERPGGWPLPDDTHTLVEAYAGGWAWSIPVAPGCRYLGVMVEPQVRTAHAGAPVADAYLAEVRRTRHLSVLFAEARRASEPAAWDASMYRTTPVVAGDTVVIGDAASFVDPVSSAGVKKALASGWLAAVAINTAVVHPERREAAFGLYASRESAVYARFLSLTRRHLAEAGRHRAHPFWLERADGDEAEEDGPLSPGRLRQDPAVRAAFEWLRAAPALTLARGPGLRIVTRPAIQDTVIGFERRLASDAQPDGIRFLRGVDVVALVELAPAHSEVPHLYDTYRRAHGPVTLPDFMGALATAVAAGWLVARA